MWRHKNYSRVVSFSPNFIPVKLFPDIKCCDEFIRRKNFLILNYDFKINPNSETTTNSFKIHSSTTGINPNSILGQVEHVKLKSNLTQLQPNSRIKVELLTTQTFYNIVVSAQGDTPNILS